MRENVERTSNAEQELETFSVLLYEILEYLLVKNQLLIYFSNLPNSSYLLILFRSLYSNNLLIMDLSD